MKNTLRSNSRKLLSIGTLSILCLSFFFLPTFGADDQFISTTIEDPTYWVTEGVKAFSMGDFDSSLLMFNTAIALNPQYALGWHWRSKALTELGSREAAEESLNVAEALEPNIQDPYRMRVGTLADIRMTPIPTLRPIETEEDDEYVKSTIETEKKPDPEGADIVLTALEASVDPKTNQLNLTTTYANIGLKATRFFYITYHISSSSRITGEDQSIGYYFVKNLFPGEEKTVNLYIPISRIPIGEWYIAAFADLVNNVVEQSDENNAIALRDKRLVVPTSKTGASGEGYIVSADGETKSTSLPVLQVSALSGSDIMYIGKETRIETTIQNIGTGDAEPFKARLILSRDVRVGEDDIILSESEVPGLKAGTATDGVITPIVPDMQPGYYYYGLVLDTETRVEESEKSNVVFSPLPIRVIKEVESISAVTFVDLVVESLSAPKTAYLGGQVEVTAVIRNDGAISSGPIGVALYVSKDTTITENDILISYGQTEIAAGTTRSASSVPVIPADLSPGEWYFGIILDPDRTVSEENRENNRVIAPHVTIIS